MGADPMFFRVVVFNCPEKENIPCLTLGPVRGPPGSLLVKCCPICLLLIYIPQSKVGFATSLAYSRQLWLPLGINWVFSAVSFEMTLHTTIKTLKILDCLKASSDGFY